MVCYSSIKLNFIYITYHYHSILIELMQKAGFEPATVLLQQKSKESIRRKKGKSYDSLQTNYSTKIKKVKKISLFFISFLENCFSLFPRRDCNHCINDIIDIFTYICKIPLHYPLSQLSYIIYRPKPPNVCDFEYIKDICYLR